MAEEMVWIECPMITGKFHVFKNGRSLCGRWMQPPCTEDDQAICSKDNTLGRDDCKTCFKKMQKELLFTKTAVKHEGLD